jgi:hypothetical protein
MSKVPIPESEDQEWYIQVSQLIENADSKKDLNSISKLLKRLDHRIEERRRFL